MPVESIIRASLVALTTFNWSTTVRRSWAERICQWDSNSALNQWEMLLDFSLWLAQVDLEDGVSSDSTHRFSTVALFPTFSCSFQSLPIYSHFPRTDAASTDRLAMSSPTRAAVSCSRSLCVICDNVCSSSSCLLLQSTSISRERNNRPRQMSCSSSFSVVSTLFWFSALDISCWRTCFFSFNSRVNISMVFSRLAWRVVWSWTVLWSI